jgi:hypothetical protein
LASTIFCSKCGTKNEIAGKFCAHCGEPIQGAAQETIAAPKASFLKLFAIAGAILISLIVLAAMFSPTSGGGDPPQAREVLESDRVQSAKVACEKFVSSGLKAPSTAKFSDRAEFLALRGRAKEGKPSESSLIAVTLSRSMGNPAVDAFPLDKKLNFLSIEDYKMLKGRFTRTRDDSKAHALVQAALERRFEMADYVVTGFVDAQNSFGAMLRSGFICLIDEAGNDQWRPDVIVLVD